MTRGLSFTVFILGAVVCAVVGAASVLLAPHWLAPAPMAVVIPIFALSMMLGDYGSMYARSYAPISALIIYLAIVLPLLFSLRIANLWLWIVFAAVAVADLTWLVLMIADGFKWQGPPYTLFVTLLNVIALVATYAVIIRSQRRASRTLQLLGGISLTLWTVWVAFPWFGEMP